MATVPAAGSPAVTIPVIPRFFQSSWSFCRRLATSLLVITRTAVATQVLGSAGAGPTITARSPAMALPAWFPVMIAPPSKIVPQLKVEPPVPALSTTHQPGGASKCGPIEVQGISVEIAAHRDVVGTARRHRRERTEAKPPRHRDRTVRLDAMPHVKARTPILRGKVVLVRGKGAGSVTIAIGPSPGVKAREGEFRAHARMQVGDDLVLPVKRAGLVQIDTVDPAIGMQSASGKGCVDVARAQHADAAGMDVVGR